MMRGRRQKRGSWRVPNLMRPTLLDIGVRMAEGGAQAFGTVGFILVPSFLVLLGAAPAMLVAGATPATVSFCLRPPAVGQIRWVPGAGMAPTVLRVAARGLPSNADLGVFVDEGTAREAYWVAHVKTGPSGAAVVSVRASRMPTHVRRLLLESMSGATVTVSAIAYPCQGGLTSRPSTRLLLGTVRVDQLPVAVTIDVGAGRVFVVSYQSGPHSLGGSVSMLDAQTGTVLSHAPLGMHPGAIAVDGRTGRAFIANTGSNTVSVLNTHSGTILRNSPVGSAPDAIVVDERVDRVFVADRGGGVSVLDARNGEVIRSSVVGGSAAAIAVDATTNRVFVVDGGVRELDAESGAILQTVRVGQYPRAVAVDVHTHRAFVTSIGAVDPSTNPIGAGTISVLDTRSGRLLRTVPAGTNPGAVAVDERTNRAFVTNLASGSVSILDARSGRVLRTAAVGEFPLAVAVDDQTGRVFVANRNSDSVSILDATSGHVVQTVAVGTGAAAAPSAVAVDARTGRAFVVDANTDSVSVLDATH